MFALIICRGGAQMSLSGAFRCCLHHERIGVGKKTPTPGLVRSISSLCSCGRDMPNHSSWLKNSIVDW